jgi:hypothetical protein
VSQTYADLVLILDGCTAPAGLLYPVFEKLLSEASPLRELYPTSPLLAGGYDTHRDQ